MFSASLFYPFFCVFLSRLSSFRGLVASQRGTTPFQIYAALVALLLEITWSSFPETLQKELTPSLARYKEVFETLLQKEKNSPELDSLAGDLLGILTESEALLEKTMGASKDELEKTAVYEAFFQKKTLFQVDSSESKTAKGKFFTLLNASLTSNWAADAQLTGVLEQLQLFKENKVSPEHLLSFLEGVVKGESPYRQGVTSLAAERAAQALLRGKIEEFCKTLGSRKLPADELETMAAQLAEVIEEESEIFWDSFYQKAALSSTEALAKFKEMRSLNLSLQEKTVFFQYLMTTFFVSGYSRIPLKEKFLKEFFSTVVFPPPKTRSVIYAETNGFLNEFLLGKSMKESRIVEEEIEAAALAPLFETFQSGCKAHFGHDVTSPNFLENAVFLDTLYFPLYLKNDGTIVNQFCGPSFVASVWAAANTSVNSQKKAVRLSHFINIYISFFKDFLHFSPKKASTPQVFKSYENSLSGKEVNFHGSDHLYEEFKGVVGSSWLNFFEFDVTCVQTRSFDKIVLEGKETEDRQSQQDGVALRLGVCRNQLCSPEQKQRFERFLNSQDVSMGSFDREAPSRVVLCQFLSYHVYPAYYQMEALVDRLSSLFSHPGQFRFEKMKALLPENLRNEPQKVKERFVLILLQKIFLPIHRKRERPIWVKFVNETAVYDLETALGLVGDEGILRFSHLQQNRAPKSFFLRFQFFQGLALKTFFNMLSFEVDTESPLAGSVSTLQTKVNKLVDEKLAELLGKKPENKVAGTSKKAPPKKKESPKKNTP